VKYGVLEQDKPNDGDEDTGNIGAGLMLFCRLSPPRACKSSLLGLKKKVKKDKHTIQEYNINRST